jgi:hypothetical protein
MLIPSLLRDGDEETRGTPALHRLYKEAGGGTPDGPGAVPARDSVSGRVRVGKFPESVGDRRGSDNYLLVTVRTSDPIHSPFKGGCRESVH